MKQTALQQLIERLEKRFEQDKAIYENLQQQEDTNLRQLEKAKGKWYSSRDAWKTACEFLEIEKQDIIEAYGQGGDDRQMSHTVDAEQYYTQTFKQ